MATIDIFQLENGYCYNTDSLILAHFAKDFLKPSCKNLLDIGCGSGVLALLCAREMQGGAWDLVEKEPNMAKCAMLNTKHIDAKVHCMDFLDFKSIIKYDFIISNPPFYPKGTLKGQNDSKNMARISTFLPLEPMLKHIKRLLAPNGVLCMCYDARLSDDICYQMRFSGLNIELMRFVHPLKHKDASIVLLKAKIQSNANLKVLPPLFIHKSTTQSDNTKALKDIYQWAKTNSIKLSQAQLDNA